MILFEDRWENVRSHGKRQPTCQEDHGLKKLAGTSVAASIVGRAIRLLGGPVVGIFRESPDLRGIATAAGIGIMTAQNIRRAGLPPRTRQ